MKKTHVLTAVLAAVTLTAGSADAAGHKCKVVKNGVGKIVEGKGDCGGTGADGKGSCQGNNKRGDPNAWIYVPTKAACDKINAGDFSGDLAKYKSKVEQ